MLLIQKAWTQFIIRLLFGFFIVLVLHSFYDFFIIQHIADVLMLGAMFVLTVGIVWSVRLTKELQKASPFKF